MPTIGLLAYSKIADDPRVRKQGDAFQDAGWKVLAAGIAGGLSEPPSWRILHATTGKAPTPATEETRPTHPQRFWRQRLARLALRATGPAKRAIKRGNTAALHLKARRSLRHALEVYWSVPQYVELYKLARTTRPDIWLANDWNTLPIAARLVEEQGNCFGYDAHEFATREYEERLAWRIFRKPLVRQLEEHFIKQAVCVSSVSAGIAAALQAQYDLGEIPMTVMNAPSYAQTALRKTQEPARVLYHGGVTPGRGLEETIVSVAQWRDGRTLTIRGPVEPAYRERLEATIAKHGLGARVRLEPPIPMIHLVAEARPFDIGILALPFHSQQNAFALPNKLFEYAMAGLALCMSDHAEMGHLIRLYDMGTTISATTPAKIAEAINSMDTARIDRLRKNALQAARRLSWEETSRQMIDRYASVLSTWQASRFGHSATPSVAVAQ